jgi:hypothetical protein
VADATGVRVYLRFNRHVTVKDVTENQLSDVETGEMVAFTSFTVGRSHNQRVRLGFIPFKNETGESHQNHPQPGAKRVTTVFRRVIFLLFRAPPVV